MTAPNNIDRFLQAQNGVYETALKEIRSGRKVSHWMWFIFPQIKGLGSSETAIFYGIQDLKEAADYLRHETLGSRLIQMSNALLELSGNDPVQIFGRVDSLKLRSSMTLFSLVEDADPVFQEVIDIFFAGVKDEATIQLAAGK